MLKLRALAEFLNYQCIMGPSPYWWRSVSNMRGWCLRASFLLLTRLWCIHSICHCCLCGHRALSKHTTTSLKKRILTGYLIPPKCQTNAKDQINGKSLKNIHGMAVVKSGSSYNSSLFPLPHKRQAWTNTWGSRREKCNEGSPSSL